jgi:hypothetical protein
MEVELDIYSGRENPRVPLPAAAAEALASALASLPDAAAAAEPEALGYRGLVIAAPSAAIASLRIRGGRVAITDAAGAVAWREDAGRRLERRLIEAIAPSLEPALAAYLREATSR